MADRQIYCKLEGKVFTLYGYTGVYAWLRNNATKSEIAEGASMTGQEEFRSDESGQETNG